MTDHVISNNLVVLGMSTFAGGQTFDGQMIVDLNSAEALLVRRDGDSGDVFIVNTNTPSATLAGPLEITDTDTRALVVSQSSFGAEVFFVDTNNDEVRLPTGSLFALSGTIGAAAFTVASLIQWNDANAPRINNVASTATVPPILPNRAAATTGIGGVSGEISLIVVGVDQLNFDGATIDAAFPIQGVNANSYAVLNETASATNPTLIPRRADLTTGVGGTDAEGDSHLHLIIEGANVVDISANSAVWNLGNIMTMNNGLFINGLTDSLQLRVQGHSTQTNIIFTVEQSTGVDIFTIDNGGFVTLGGLNYIQFQVAGPFSSGGGSNLVSGAMFASDITGFSGDVALSHIRAGVTGGGSIVTSGAGDSVFAATLWLDEPNITLTPSDAMATAATLYISNAPTEGTSDNYALFIDNGSARFDGAVIMFANSSFPNPANTFTFGSGVPQTHTHVAVIGAFTSSGISNHAERVFIGGSVTGFNGDTVSLAGLNVDATITTQGATQVIADVAQVRINEPGITVGTGDTITNAQSLLIVAAPTEGANNYALRVAAGDVLLGGNLAVSGVGPHSIAGVTFGAVQLLIGSTFTSDGASDIAAGLFHTPAIVGAPGDTSALTGTTLTAGITTQTATESIANIAQLQINEPAITDNLTGSITNAQSLLITGAPTEGVSNWALRIISGDVEIGGDLIEFGAGGGNSRMTFRGCSTFYLGNLDTPDEMFFGSGSTVTVASAVASFEGSVFKFRNSAANEQFMRVRQVSTLLATPSGSSATVAAIPAGSFVVGVTTRVVTTVTGPAGYDVGDGTDVDRWGNSIPVASGNTSDLSDATADAHGSFAATNDVVITSDGVDFTGGSIRITVHYMDLQAPSS